MSTTRNIEAAHLNSPLNFYSLERFVEKVPKPREPFVFRQIEAGEVTIPYCSYPQSEGSYRVLVGRDGENFPPVLSVKLNSTDTTTGISFDADLKYEGGERSDLYFNFQSHKQAQFPPMSMVAMCAFVAKYTIPKIPDSLPADRLQYNLIDKNHTVEEWSKQAAKYYIAAHRVLSGLIKP